MEIESYQIWKLIHYVGVVIFLGNITITAVWKTLANATNEPKIIAYSQRLVTITDFVFTLVGVILILFSGYIMADRFGGANGKDWLITARTLFSVSAVIWIVILIPIQIMQSRMAKSFHNDGIIAQRYWVLSRIWLYVGSIAVILPFIVLYYMVVKP